jgi:hypothetical protein
MTVDDRASILHAEANTLRELLAEEPEATLDRLSLEVRLQEVEAELRTLESGGRRGYRARAALVFDGEPVFGSRAIDAEFAGEMLLAAQRMVTAMNAQRTRGKLARKGKIPDSQRARLVVSGTLHGSFGFYLEELQAGIFETPGSAALSRVLNLLSAARETNETFASAVAETDPRVLRVVRAFLKRASSAGATFRINTDEGSVAFNPEDIEAATARAWSTRIVEIQRKWTGVLTGVFAEARRFEFKPDDRDQIEGEKIEGPISDDLDPHYLSRLLLQRCFVHVEETQTTPTGGGLLRRYMLWAAESLPK